MNDALGAKTLAVYKSATEANLIQPQSCDRKTPIVYDALVLDARLRQSLMTVRSLGRRNKRVAALETLHVFQKSHHVPTFSSRWCQATYIAPSYVQDTTPFITYLERLLDQSGAHVLISSADGTIAALRKHRAQIEQRGVRIALASEAALSLAVDKDQTVHVAKQVGVGVPRGVTVTSVAEVAEAIREIGLPAVIKPTRSWLWGEQQGQRVDCKLVTTPDEARRAVERLTQGGGTILFQQFLSGRQESVSLFYANNDIYASFAQWTMRAQPPLGGVSTYRQSIPIPSDSGMQSERLVREIGLEGYSQVQFRRDSFGKPYLMEINPRLTSGIEVAVRAGIDFPYLLYQWASGEPINHIKGYHTGVRMRYLEGDLLTTLQTFSQRGRPGVTPPSQALLAFLGTFLVPTGYDYLDWHDLRPLWSATGEFMDRVRRRLRRKQ